MTPVIFFESDMSKETTETGLTYCSQVRELMSLELVQDPAIQRAVLDELKVREALTKGVVRSPVLYAHSSAKGRLSML